MASGSSGRANPGSKGFDFGSDDILCSYEDYVNQDSSNGSHSDPVIGSTSSKVTGAGSLYSVSLILVGNEIFFPSLSGSLNCDWGFVLCKWFKRFFVLVYSTFSYLFSLGWSINISDFICYLWLWSQSLGSFIRKDIWFPNNRSFLLLTLVIIGVFHFGQTQGANNTLLPLGLFGLES